MLHAPGNRIIPKQESGLKLGIGAPNECLRKSLIFRNQECNSYENGSESVHIKSCFIASDEEEVRRKNAAA